jgi:hypothetical protein
MKHLEMSHVAPVCVFCSFHVYLLVATSFGNLLLARVTKHLLQTLDKGDCIWPASLRFGMFGTLDKKS